jgi:hypothetical protein
MAVVEETVTLDVIARRLDELQTEQRALREEVRNNTGLALPVLGRGHRVEQHVEEIRRHMYEIRDDLKLMIKSEIMGRFPHVKTRLDKELDRLWESMAEKRRRT